MATDISAAEPRFALVEILELGLPAWHLGPAGEIDHHYDGADFWREIAGRACSKEQRDELPADGWRHRPDCACLACRQGRRRCFNLA